MLQGAVESAGGYKWTFAPRPKLDAPMCKN